MKSGDLRVNILQCSKDHNNDNQNDVGWLGVVFAHVLYIGMCVGSDSILCVM